MEVQTHPVLVVLYPSDEIDEFKQQFGPLSEEMVHHDSLASCMTFIETNAQATTKLLLIVFHGYVDNLLAQRETFAAVESIFIDCVREEHFTFVYDGELNIVGAYDRIDRLHASVDEQLEWIHQQTCRWSVYDQHDYADRDLSGQAFDFLWIHLLHQVIGQFAHDDRARQQFMDTLRALAQDNASHLQFVDELDEKYQSTDVLLWYGNNPFLRNAISAALHKQDMDQLYSLRYVLADLTGALHGESHDADVVVHRTLNMSPGEVNYLNANIGKLVTYKGFLSAAERSNLHLEILFNLAATFRLESIEQCDQAWHMQLTAVDDGRKIVQKYLDDTRRQAGNVSSAVLFGRLMFDLCRWDQSQRYFERLRDEAVPSEDRPWIEHGIGQVLHQRMAWEAARTVFDRAYEELIASDPPRLQDAAILLCDIGRLLDNQGKYDEALDFYRRALVIQQESYPEDHPLIANSLEVISFTYDRQSKDGMALDFCQRALAIRERYYPAEHPDVAQSLAFISHFLIKQQRYGEALAYLQRALAICKRSYQAFHLNTVYALHNMAAYFRAQENFHECFQLDQQVLIMLRRIRSGPHREFAHVLNLVAWVYSDRGLYGQAVELQQQALAISRACLPADHEDIAHSLTALGSFLLGRRGGAADALSSYEQALEILEQSLSPAVSAVAYALNGMAQAFARQGEPDQDLVQHQRALTILEEYYSSDDLELTYTLINIGHVLSSQDKWDDALVHYQRALCIQQKTCAADHLHISYTLNHMGNLCERRENFEEALRLHQQALTIQKKVFPAGHATVMTTLNSIGQIASQPEHCLEALEYYYQQAVDLTEQASPTYQLQMANSLQNVAEKLLIQGRYDEGTRLYEQVLTTYEKSPSTEHPNMISCLHQIAFVFRKQGQHTRELQCCERILALYENQSPPDDLAIATTLFNIGRLLYAERNFAECDRVCERAMHIYEDDYPHCVELAHCLLCRSAVAHQHDDHQRALQLQRRVLEMFAFRPWYNSDVLKMCLSMIRDSLREPSHSEETPASHQGVFTLRADIHSSDYTSIAGSLACYGRIFYLLDSHDEALAAYEQALAIYERHPPSDELETHMCLMYMGELFRNAARFDEALQAYGRALTICVRHHATAPALTATTLLDIGHIRFDQAEFDHALNLYCQALTLARELDPADHEIILKCIESIESSVRRAEDISLKLCYGLQCLLMREQVLRPYDFEIGRNLSSIAICYEMTGELKTALEYYQRALVIYEQVAWDIFEDIDNMMVNIRRVRDAIEAQD